MKQAFSAKLVMLLVAASLFIGYSIGKVTEGTAHDATRIQLVQVTGQLSIEQLRRTQQQLEHNLLVEYIVQCESSGQTDVWGDLNYPYPSYGVAQFQERTFNRFATEAEFDGAEWKNPHHQIYLLDWALRQGYGKHWKTCYAKSKDKIATEAAQRIYNYPINF